MDASKSTGVGNGIDLTTEWQRSQPDIVVYLPGGGRDTDNEHFLVFAAPSGEELLAVWTQSSCEGRGDNHLVIARSADGEQWSEPVFVVGARGEGERQASWGFPVVARTGRIYLFHTRETEIVDNNRQGSGAMGCVFSDDAGRTWVQGDDVPMERNRFDHPDPDVPRNWIVWQKPVRDSQGRWIAGYTQCTSKEHIRQTYSGWVNWDSRSAFMRFENIDEGPPPEELEISWLPRDREGLEVTNRVYPEMSVAQEPALVRLPDSRLMVVMRTMTGHIWYSVSVDDGETWREPEVLRFADGGEPVPHPMSPCPIFALDDGRFVLIFHNNDGRKEPYDQFKKVWDVNQSNFLRNPTFFAVGQFAAEAHQPLRFGCPVDILDTDGIPIGPKGTAEIGTYPSLTEFRDKRVLWYPDRKYYLLGKYLPDELLARSA